MPDVLIGLDALAELRDRLRRDVPKCRRERDAFDLTRYADAVDAAIALTARLALAEAVCEAADEYDAALRHVNVRHDSAQPLGSWAVLLDRVNTWRDAREADEVQEKHDG